MQFRIKPVVIDASQWFKPGDHPNVEPYADQIGVIKGIGPYGWVATLEGGHIVSPGDWIIRGVKGELYPCKPDVFAATYDVAEDEEKQRIGWITCGITRPAQELLAAIKGCTIIDWRLSASCSRLDLMIEHPDLDAVAAEPSPLPRYQAILSRTAGDVLITRDKFIRMDKPKPPPEEPQP